MNFTTLFLWYLGVSIKICLQQNRRMYVGIALNILSFFKL